MENNEYNCVLGLPYPLVCGKEKNKSVVEQLYRVYAKELSTIADYIYLSLILDKEFTVLSDIFDCISTVEIRHIKMIGELIFILGYDPVIRYADGVRKTKSVMRTPSATDSYLKNMIYKILFNENDVLKDYDKIVELTSDNDIKTLINRIILDEQHHIEMFSRFLK